MVASCQIPHKHDRHSRETSPVRCVISTVLLPDSEELKKKKVTVQIRKKKKKRSEAKLEFAPSFFFLFSKAIPWNHWQGQERKPRETTVRKMATRREGSAIFAQPWLLAALLPARLSHFEAVNQRNYHFIFHRSAATLSS